MASPKTHLLRVLLVLCINFQLLENKQEESDSTTSVTDDVFDWLISNKIIDSTSDSRYSYYFGYAKKWFSVQNIKYGSIL